MMLTPFFTPERIFLLCCAAGGFIIGQLQFSFFFSKLKKKDLRHHGTGSYGATNAFRVLGAPFGILTFLLDFGKTVLAIYIATRVLPLHPELIIDMHALVLYTGFGVVLGHIFPVYLKFNGGKGFSCTLATFFCLQDIKLIGVVILVFLVMFLVSRYVSLASLVTVFFGSISFMFFMLMRWTFVETNWIFDCQCVLVLLFIFSLIAHRSNIVRLVFGDERKFYFRKKKRLEAMEEDYTNFDKYYDEVEAEESGLATVEASLLDGEADLAGEVSDEMTEAAEEAAEEAEEAAEEVVEETAEETIEAEAAEEALVETEAETETTAEETPETTEETVEKESESTEGAVEETAESVEEIVVPAVETALEEGESAAEETVEETAEAAENIAETEEAVEETVEEATEEVAVETAEEVTETVEESVDGLEETAEDTLEEVTEAAEELTEATEEAMEKAEEAVEETVEEAAEETEDTIDKAAAAAIPLAGFFGRIKSLFRKPEQQEETDLFSREESLEAASEGVPEDMEESVDTIEDHLKTKFKDFDITKKVVLSIGSEEEPPVDGQQEETPEAVAEEEKETAPAVGLFAAGIFEKMKDKLQKVVHPGEKAIPEFLSDEVNETVEESIETSVETAEEAVAETTETVEDAAAVLEEATEEAAETVEETTDVVKEDVSDAVEETAEETSERIEEVSEEILETVVETAEETAEGITEEAAETVEEATNVVKEEVSDAVEETAEAVGETAAVVDEAASETEDSFEESTEEIVETAEKTNEEELTGGVVLPGFFGRMKAKILKSVLLDEWEEEAKEVSEEIEDAADSIFGDIEAGEPVAKEERFDQIKDSEEITDSIEEVLPSDKIADVIAEEPIEAETEKAPSKFAGFLNKVRSILPNQEEEPETYEEEVSELTETAGDVSEGIVETSETAADEISETIQEELPEGEVILEDFVDEPKTSFFGKIRDKFRNFDISKKIGLTLNEEDTENTADTVGDLSFGEEVKETVEAESEDFRDRLEDIKEELADKAEEFHEDIQEKADLILEDLQEKREDVHEVIAEKVEDIKDSVEEKVTDFHETIEEKVDGFKENVEEKVDGFKESIDEKVDDIRHDLEIKEAETKAEIELQTEKVAQDLKEVTEEISDDFKKKI